MKDKIVEEVRNDLLSRSEKGIKKYGITLDRNDLDLSEWLQHAYEETLDKALYLKKAIKENNLKLQIAIHTLSNIPNHYNVGPNKESSYEIISKLEK